MRSAAAERAKEEQRREMLALSVEERVELARRLRRSHKRGRRPSVLNEE